MKQKNPFKDLTRFELVLWIVSLVVVTLSAVLSPSPDYLNLCASLIGVTALIFVAKGYVLGQILTVVFAVFYGIISFVFGYYGEMITYVFMTAPIAIASVITWSKNPYKDSAEVEVSTVTGKQVLIMAVLACVVTTVFYFILDFFNTQNIVFSTISITTSFVAVYLTVLRSHFYALGYLANDIVLIVLWSCATASDIAYLPMIACFSMFLLNDLYGFINWQRMKNRQLAKTE